MAAFEAELARCPIFLEMSPDECQEVLDLARVETCRARHTILREGQLTQMLWIILRGRCEVVKTANDGSEQQLGVLERGGTLALAGVTMTPIPELNYDRLLYWERTVRSVANFTRQDARELLDLAAEIPIRTTVQRYRLQEANEALLALKRSEIDGTAVLMVH